MVCKTFHHYYFACEVSKITNHKPLVVIFKKGFASLPQTSKKTTKNAWAPLTNTIQALDTAINHRLSIQTQQWNKQGQRNLRNIHCHQCNRVMYIHTSLYNSRRNKNSNATWWAHWHGVRTHTTQLAINQSRDAEKPATILVIQRWDCNHKQHCNEKQNNNNNTCNTVWQGTTTAAHEQMGIGKTKLLVYKSIYWISLNADIKEIIKKIVPLSWPCKQYDPKMRQCPTKYQESLGNL